MTSVHPITEYRVHAITNAPRPTAAQRRKLTEHLDHWLPDILTEPGSLQLRMTIRLAGEEAEAVRRVKSVLRRTLAHHGISGKVEAVKVLQDLGHDGD